MPEAAHLSHTEACACSLQETSPGKPALQLDPEKVAEALQRFCTEVQRHVASQTKRRTWSQDAREALLEGCEGLAQVDPCSHDQMQEQRSLMPGQHMQCGARSGL